MIKSEERYARQILLPEIGTAGQRKLSEASVLVIGAGGLGAPVLQYLAAAGIGRICVMDRDVVSESNLNRQILYGGQDIGQPKAQLAVQRLHAINDSIELTAIVGELSDESAPDIVRKYDAVVLCLDSASSRLIANRACVELGVPFVEAGVHGFCGTLTTVIPRKTACYACIHPTTRASDVPVPILGAMAAWVGSAEALAAIRLLLGLPTPSEGAIVYFDGAELTTERIALERNLSCPICGALY